MLLATVVAALAFAPMANAESASSCDGRPVADHVHRAHALFQRVYRDDFNLPDTDPYVRKAQKHKLCIRIARVRNEIERYRDQRKADWYQRVNPYTGGGQRWALPYYIVVCESGAGSGSSNYYGLLQGWHEWNWGLVQTADAGSAPKLHQDMAAHRGYVMHGGSPWTCA